MFKNISKYSIFLIAICFSACLLLAGQQTVNAETYYVSNQGDDSQTGTSPEQAWENITKINASEFNPGDSILFNKGNTWRNQPLQISSSGLENQNIILGSYGEGTRPEILGSLVAENWISISPNIWASSTTINENPRDIGYDGPEIFFEEIDGKVRWGLYQSYTSSFINLTGEYHWTWNNNTIYIFSPTDPNSRYSQVEVPQLAQGILLGDHDYITITGLSVKYYGDAGIYDSYQTPRELLGLTVTDCEIGYIGKKNGDAAYGLNVHHSDSYYAYNEIHNCGRRGISLTMYNTTASIQRNVIIEKNRFHHGWHTTSLDCGASGPHTIENIVFRNNLVEGDPSIVLGGENSNSNHVFIADQSGGGATVENFYFYNNIFTYASASSIKSESVSKVYVYNNTFYNFNPSLANWQAHIYTSGMTDEYIVMNNIFHNNAVDNRWTAIKVDEATRHHMVVDRNLYFQSGDGKRFWWVNGGTSYKDFEWQEYLQATGNDQNSPEPEDPLFASPTTDFSLQEISPARGQGIAVAGISIDYEGIPMNNPPDLGSHQYHIAKGDINKDRHVNLTDAIIGLGVAAGSTEDDLSLEADVDGDSKIGLEEVLFILRNSD